MNRFLSGKYCYLRGFILCLVLCSIGLCGNTAFVFFTRVLPKGSVAVQTSATASSMVFPAPSTSAVLADASVQPESVPPGVPLEYLPANRTYISTGQGYRLCLHIAARKDVPGNNTPYPYELTVLGTSVAIDCGFFGAMYDPGWRTAYCLSADKRSREVVRLFLYVVETDAVINVRIDTNDLGTFKEGDCND